MKTILTKVSELPSDLRDGIYKRTPTDDRVLITEATPLSWLPLSLNVRLTENIWSVLGAEMRQDFFRRVLLADIDSSLLRSFAATTIKLFGMDPASFIRWTPRAWPLIFRECTDLLVLGTSRAEGRLAFDNPVRELSDVWFESCRASFTGFFELAKTSGEVVLEKPRGSSRRRVLLFRWR